jgi:hypothetical protein
MFVVWWVAVYIVKKKKDEGKREKRYFLSFLVQRSVK